MGVALITAGFVVEDNLDQIYNAWTNLTTDHSGTVAAIPPEHHAPAVTSTNAGGQARPEVGAADAVGTAPHHTLTLGSLVVLLLKELGVACLVAGVIGLVIERQAKEHDSRRARELQMAVAENAVFALFGLSHDPDFIQAVVDTNLKARVVRRKMEMTYSLRTLTEEEAKQVNPTAPRAALKRFLMLDMEQRYEFENVSSAPYEMQIPQAAATRKGTGARAVTRVTFLALNDKPLTPDQIRKGIDTERSTDHNIHYSWKHLLGPHKSDSSRVSIVSNISCLKELSDNEVWGSFFPTMGDVTLTLKVLPGMNFGVRPLSNGDLRIKTGEPRPEEKTYILAGPLLRHNSVVFWWRTHEDDGEEGTTPPPTEFSESPGPHPADDTGGQHSAGKAPVPPIKRDKN